MISPNTAGVMKFSCGRGGQGNKLNSMTPTLIWQFTLMPLPLPSTFNPFTDKYIIISYKQVLLLPWTLYVWPSWGRSRRLLCEWSAACQPPPGRRAERQGRGCEEHDAGMNPGNSAKTHQTPPGGGDRPERQTMLPYFYCCDTFVAKWKEREKGPRETFVC